MKFDMAAKILVLNDFKALGTFYLATWMIYCQNVS